MQLTKASRSITLLCFSIFLKTKFKICYNEPNPFKR
jgi:hypothetical protein